jgi:hypothetical protein
MIVRGAGRAITEDASEQVSPCNRSVEMEMLETPRTRGAASMAGGLFDPCLVSANCQLLDRAAVMNARALQYCCILACCLPPAIALINTQ